MAKTRKPYVPKRYFRVDFTIGEPGPDNQPQMTMASGRNEYSAVLLLKRELVRRSGGKLDPKTVYVVSIAEVTELEAFRHASDLLQRYHDSEKAKLRKE